MDSTGAHRQGHCEMGVVRLPAATARVTRHKEIGDIRLRGRPRSS